MIDWKQLAVLAGLCLVVAFFLVAVWGALQALTEWAESVRSSLHRIAFSLEELESIEDWRSDLESEADLTFGPDYDDEAER